MQSSLGVGASLNLRLQQKAHRNNSQFIMPNTTSNKKDEVEQEDPDEEVSENVSKDTPKKQTKKPTKKKKGDDGDNEPLPAEVQTKKRPLKVANPEPEEDKNQDEEEDDEETKAGKRRAQIRRSKKAKSVGLRSLARQAGYNDRGKDGRAAATGIDGTHSLLSLADAKRLMRFVPATPGAPAFGEEEMNKRQFLFENGVPSGAARETQAHCDAVLRNVMNEAVLRAAESGKKNVSAYDMMCVLRPYAQNMMFTSGVTPCIGQIRHAQEEGILTGTEADKEAQAAEKKVNSAYKKKYDAYTSSLKAKQEERKEAKKAGAEKAKNP